MDSQNLALVSLSFSHSLRVIRSTFQMGLIAIFFPARNSCQCGVVCCLASDQASGILLLEMTQFMVYRTDTLSSWVTSSHQSSQSGNQQILRWGQIKLICPPPFNPAGYQYITYYECRNKHAALGSYRPVETP